MKIGEALGMAIGGFKRQASDRWPLPRCMIGLEFEFENPEQHAILNEELREISWYEHKNDGSLRDNGIEFVLREPMFGEDIFDAVTGMCNFARRKRLVTNYRTGLHVHLDVRDMEQEELRRLVAFYCLLERPLFEFIGPHRWDSNFCVPVIRHASQLNEIRNICTTDNKAAVKDTAKAIQRYSALNLNALARFGSVEFRHAECMTDPEKINNWVAVIMSIKKAAQTARFNTTYEAIAQFSMLGAHRFSRDVIGVPDFFLEFCTDADMWEGVHVAQEVALNLRSAGRWEDPFFNNFKNKVTE